MGDTTRRTTFRLLGLFLVVAGAFLGQTAEAQTNVEPYDITLRSEKGSDISATEVDDSYRALRNFFTQTEADYHFWIPGGGSDPSTCDPADGDGGMQLWWNSTSDVIKCCTGVNTWTTCGGGGATFTSFDTDYGAETVTSTWTLQYPNRD